MPVENCEQMLPARYPRAMFQKGSREERAVFSVFSFGGFVHNRAKRHRETVDTEVDLACARIPHGGELVFFGDNVPRTFLPAAAEGASRDVKHLGL